MMWGRLHEAAVSDYWCARNRSVIRNVGLIGNVDQPWHQTSLDRLVLECPLDRQIKEQCALEVKTRGAFGMKRWHIELPDDVLAQICHQLFTTGLDHIHYAVLIGGNTFKQGVVLRDKEAETITFVIDQCNDFRGQYLRYGNEIEPPWDVNMAAQTYLELEALKFPDRTGVHELDFEGLDELLTAAEIRSKANHYAALNKKQKAILHRLADGARHVTYAGELAYEFSPRSRIKIDQERLAEKYPNVWTDPEIVSQTTYWQLDLAPAYKATEEQA
jgi:predicted phage-related endonuclease